MLEASKGSVETDRRVSKRSRKTKNGSSISLKVSASTTLYQLKMMIWESFGVSLSLYMYIVLLCLNVRTKHVLKMTIRSFCNS